MRGRVGGEDGGGSAGGELIEFFVEVVGLVEGSTALTTREGKVSLNMIIGEEYVWRVLTVFMPIQASMTCMSKESSPNDLADW